MGLATTKLAPQSRARNTLARCVWPLSRMMGEVRVPSSLDRRNQRMNAYSSISSVAVPTKNRSASSRPRCSTAADASVKRASERTRNPPSTCARTSSSSGLLSSASTDRAAEIMPLVQFASRGGHGSSPNNSSAPVSTGISSTAATEPSRLATSERLTALSARLRSARPARRYGRRQRREEISQDEEALREQVERLDLLAAGHMPDLARQTGGDCRAHAQAG